MRHKMRHENAERSERPGTGCARKPRLQGVPMLDVLVMLECRPFALNVFV
jgi:hypothetical protein